MVNHSPLHLELMRRVIAGEIRRHEIKRLPRQLDRLYAAVAYMAARGRPYTNPDTLQVVMLYGTALAELTGEAISPDVLITASLRHGLHRSKPWVHVPRAERTGAHRAVFLVLPTAVTSSPFPSVTAEDSAAAKLIVAGLLGESEATAYAVLRALQKHFSIE